MSKCCICEMFCRCRFPKIFWFGMTAWCKRCGKRIQ